MVSPDRNVEVTLTAKDEASKVIDGVAAELEALDETTTVEVDADTSDAESKIERFERELDALTSQQAREIRIEFRENVLEGKIRSTLRALEELDDPVQIEVKQQQLEELQTDLRDVAELAQRKYEIDVEVDPKRTARQAADDIDAMRQRGEGLQSAVPALRGFTDELGGSAAAAGIAGQAIADLGDFSLIMGEKFGLSEKAMSQLGTALGALGLGSVVVGGALAAFDALGKKQREVEAATAETVSSLRDQLGLVEGLDGAFTDASSAGEAFAKSLLEDEDDLAKTNAGLEALGLTIEDLPGLIDAVNRGDRGFFADLLKGRGLDDQIVTMLTDVALGVEAVGDRAIASSSAAGELGDAFVGLADAIRGLQSEGAAGDVLSQIATQSAVGREQVRLLREELNGATDVAVLDAWITRYGDATATIDDAAVAAGLLKTAQDNVGTAGTAAGDAIVDAFDRATREYDKLRGRIDDRSSWLNLQNAFDDVEAKAVEAWNATANGAADAEQKQRAYQLALLATTQDVIDYGVQVLGLPPEKVTEIVAEMDDGNIASVESTLDALSRERDVQLNVSAALTAGAQRVLEAIAGGWGRAATTATAAPTLAPTNVTVHMSRASTGRDLDRTVSRWARVNGRG